jgi:hypothetical protein
MANPNILDTTNVVGNNALVAVTTNATSVVSNAASSGKIYKINNITASNIDGTTAADVTVNIYSEDDLGGTGYSIVYQIPVPIDSSLVVVDKTTSVFLKEDQSIGAIASGNSDIVVTASWEEIG